MDDSVRRAMAKWPDVPVVQGWLRLDAAGRWLLRDEPVTHAGLIEFIGRNYAADHHGRWYFQNGPQRVYVGLDYTPWVLHVDATGALRTHTGQDVTRLERVAIDDEGNLLLVGDPGPGVVDPDALPVLVERFVDATGETIAADAIDHAIGQLALGSTAGLLFRHGGECLPVEYVARAEVPAAFGFVAEPTADRGP